MIKYCIFTLIFNNYDLVREPLEIDDNCDYFLFTDNKNIISKKWNVIYLENFDTNKLSGIQKTYIFKYTFKKYIPNIDKYEYIIRVDASILLKKSLAPIISYLNDNNYDLSIAIHDYHNNQPTFQSEYSIWEKHRGLNPKYTKSFFNFATVDNNYPINQGYFELTIMIYKNCQQIFNLLNDVNNCMTKYNDNNDKNDQCYFSCIWYDYRNIIKTNFHPSTLYHNSKFMQVNVHNTNYAPFQYNEQYIKTRQIFGETVNIMNINL